MSRLAGPSAPRALLALESRPGTQGQCGVGRGGRAGGLAPTCRTVGHCATLCTRCPQAVRARERDLETSLERLAAKQDRQAGRLASCEAAVRVREAAVQKLEGAFVARERAHDARCGGGCTAGIAPGGNQQPCTALGPFAVSGSRSIWMSETACQLGSRDLGHVGRVKWRAGAEFAL